VGMQVEDDLVTVPGYLLGGRDMFAQPGVDGGIEAVVPANAKLTSGALPLRPGTWRVTVDPPNPDVEIGLYAEGANQRPTQVLSVTGKEKQVRLRVSSHTVSSLLGTLRVERVPNDSPEPTVAPVPTYVLEPF